jgi:hypothetical protein
MLEEKKIIEFEEKIFCGHIIRQRMSDGYLNATDMCKVNNKLYADYTRLEQTKEFLKELVSDMGIPISKLVQIKKGGNKYKQGTWIHPHVAIHLAQWVSPKFSVAVSKWVMRFMYGDLTLIEEIKQNNNLMNEQLNQSQLLLAEKNQQLRDAEAKLNRLNLLNIENLSFKKKLSKNETIYIVSTYAYSIQGIYKIGRTKNMKSRNSSHNTTHAPGDKVKILAEYKVNDSTLSERNIHNKLAGLVLKDETEIFMCPFDMLNSLVDLVINCDEQLNDAVNRIIDMVYKLRTEQFDKDKWIIGLDMSVFRDEMQLITNGNIGTEHTIAATFDMTTATEAQKQKFVRECIAAYRRTIQQPDTTESPIFNIAWKAFQEFIMSRLEVPRSRFKALEWKPFVKTEVNSNPQLMIQWRSG